ncbi:cell envelope integrity protein CreD [uncultured Deefgea sp.]|uniref:cell envelope integrity protein CreD n=1 Tax=uncultured Deefgea sp. TaxID=1304914 RepID=UPI0025952DA8|nr:cell envelope integrity protein CreD [uncultured Deefgea sp.]
MKTKWIFISAVTLLVGMLFALNLVRGLVFERQQRAQEVRAATAQSSAGEQTLKGPFLVLPLTETVATLTEKKTPAGKISEWVESSSHRNIILSPEQFSANGQLVVEVLKRGIFEAPIYRNDLILTGKFALPALSSLERAASSSREKVSSRWGQAYLALSISDVRGIEKLHGTLAGVAMTFSPGTADSKFGGGVHAPMTLPDSAQSVDFKLNLKLVGTTQLLIEPIGKESHIALSGNWPHPSFSGDFSPVERSVSAQGFTARWQTSQLATGGGSASSSHSLGLRLIDPIDRYVLNERILKYAELFLLVLFGGVFLMSVLKKISIHPMQYALVGAALSLFFLLTLSLSEHVSFGQAYGIAAGASTLLLGYYVSFVMAAWQRGVGFALVLAVLYGMLFVILKSEGVSLLMGSLTLFCLLSGVMVLTRKLDWQVLNPSIVRHIEADEALD